MDSKNDSETLAEVIGTTSGRGVVCLTLRLQDGELITLQGNTTSLREPGVRVRLSGSWQEISNCQQGRTLFVESVSRI
ncbi:hypothetical protein IMCC20628_01641 [Hoeflea sp. IMCC20628]|nr:hypothetical protein IMCC20628_01641 [Hoeflea sp. IMCC20628]